MTAPARRLDALTPLLARLAVLSPHVATRLAVQLGSLRNRITGRWPSRGEVHSLFPHLSPQDAKRVALAIGGLSERTEVMVRTIKRYGAGPARRLTSPPQPLPPLHGPRILGTFHVGAMQSIGLLFEHHHVPVILYRHGRLYEPLPPVRLESSRGQEHHRASVFHRALQHLHEGGLLLMALDMPPGAFVETECLGHPLRLARGPFALARMTGAPIVPLVGQWRSGQMHVIEGEPLQGGDVQDAHERERRLAASAGAWLERYLIDNPSEISLGLLRALLYGHEPEAGAETESPES